MAENLLYNKKTNLSSHTITSNTLRYLEVEKREKYHSFSIYIFKVFIRCILALCFSHHNTLKFIHIILYLPPTDFCVVNDTACLPLEEPQFHQKWPGPSKGVVVEVSSLKIIEKS